MSKKKQTGSGLWLHGSSGRMGQEIQKAVSTGEHGFAFVGGSAEGHSAAALAKELSRSDVDVIVDFSAPEGNALLLKAVTSSGVKDKKILIGTTGLSAAALQAWEKTVKAQKLTLLIAPNTSIGVLVGLKVALLAALPLTGLGFDVEIVETHHRAKKDAPSGTARFFADNIQKAVKGSKIVEDRSGARKAGEIGVHAVRGGGVFGEHEIRLIGDGEELKISHRAFSRQLFATGALVLARWLTKQKPGRHVLADIDPADLRP